MTIKTNSDNMDALKELEKCSGDAWYFAVKYAGVEDNEVNKEFFDMIAQARKEGKTIILKK